MRRYVAAVVFMLVMGTSPLYAQNAEFVVTTASADIHKFPSISSPVLGKAPRGKSFEVVRELGSWVRVPWPAGQDGVGYIHVTWGTISRDAANTTTRAAAGTTTRSAASTTARGAAGTAARGAAGTTTRDAAGTTTRKAASTTTRAAANTTTRAGSTESSTPDSSASTDAPVTQVPATSTAPPSAPSLPSHVIGLGGRSGTGSIGFGATGRAWTRGPLGVQLEAGRSRITNVVGSEQLSSLQLAPSVVYAVRNVVSNALWSRPYIGAGLNFYRSTPRNELGVGVPGAVNNAVGGQAFAGAEFTAARLPQFALSADFRQQWAPATFTGFDLGGFGFSMSAHWYLK